MAEPLSDAALDQLFRTARTYNGYLDKPVSLEQLHAVWDLMKMGPTSANQLPARLVWLTTPEAKERLAKHAGGTNPDKIRKAPVSVIVAMDIDFHEQLPWLFPHTDARSWFEGNEEARKLSAMRNSTLQGAYFILAARALGLDTGPMSGFDNAAVDAEFFADQPRWKSNFISTLGYGDPSTIFPRSPRPDFEVFNRVL
ncbi:malonic semialdehyde reductase [Altererythrobacter sp. CC-YST694]|uniref:malonic semialdehyde reductase n=1 Tax=Altererythrobacter sp. CC-YST694 TaxID=2755038 RepID=UPI001D0300D2|nr:malonic semialdehyde reductase [Altererythrobacter sp. CC-YST694]MCB5424066.1 malonic semialdehyde reductase [Altererythrobacter sp. CC-YST694]